MMQCIALILYWLSQNTLAMESDAPRMGIYNSSDGIYCSGGGICRLMMICISQVVGSSNLVMGTTPVMMVFKAAVMGSFAQVMGSLVILMGSTSLLTDFTASVMDL